MKTLGPGLLTREAVEQVVDEAWRGAGGNITRPFSKAAQSAFEKINEVGKELPKAEIPLDPDTYLKIFCAQIYGAQEYRGIVGFLEWSRENLRDEKHGRFSRSVLNKPAFLELYFTARIMDPHVVEMARCLRRPFVEFYIEHFLGKDEGPLRMKEMYGCGERNDYVERIARFVVKNAKALVEFLRQEQRNDEAVRVVDNIITFQRLERRSGMDVDEVFGGGIDSLLDLRNAIEGEKEDEANLTVRIWRQ